MLLFSSLRSPIRNKIFSFFSNVHFSNDGNEKQNYGLHFREHLLSLKAVPKIWDGEADENIDG